MILEELATSSAQMTVTIASVLRMNGVILQIGLFGDEDEQSVKQ